jgi:beta-galactosidase beta subunit
MVELDDGAVAVTFRHAAHRPSAAGEGVHGAQ